ncbi:complement C1q-like protein 3 [Xyrichtys novacula]|uniref:Complement C1q-like protein 3 n=1 Tax=Xyrichtys novacula TaxID=13765 RepID=A0AAV1FY98_XYRNO|nr:complement C1q-like protein 3 [Xyrichtys novacula]
MKVFMLLCLLYSAYGQMPSPSFGWNSPEDQAEGKECRDSQGACGCCTMLLEVDRLKASFNKTLSQLESDYKSTKESFDNFKARRAAFSATLSTNGSPRCISATSTNQYISYNHVLLNVGSGYDPDTGIFTVPFSGVYSITFTVYSDAGAPKSQLAACARLQVNSETVAAALDINKFDHEDSSSQVIALHLYEGDQVAVNIHNECFLCDDSGRYNTFSGFLLYHTE